MAFSTKLLLPRVLGVAFVVMMAASVQAQLNTSTRTGTGSTTGSATGTGATSALSGLTASNAAATTVGGQGAATGSSIQAVGSDQGGFAGANATQTFIGGGSTDAFVGGARQTATQAGANRQFRSIQNSQVPGSNNRQQSGSPRQIRVSIRANIQVPRMSELPQSAVAPANRVSFDRVLTSRPELSSVIVALSSEGIARLSGTADSLDTRRLAVALVRLQPGVRKVEDDIQVVESVNP
ncbi:MAG: BON domain-containing protein [Planctomycetaceae bacterium]|nr:BON domain-containing protein [Planctomycetaceae bacterium]